MNINRFSNQVGGLQPEAVVTLSSSFSVPLYHTAHKYKIRHPLGAYNISMQSVLANFEIVLGQASQLLIYFPDGRIAYRGSLALAEAQRNLLRSVDEHFDDCEKILKSFFAPGANFNGNKHVKKFWELVEPYKSNVRGISNHFKHSQGRVRGILNVHHSISPIEIVPAYFIEGVDKSGNPGPDPIIHAEPRNAISFAHDLRYHFCNLYFISHHLSEAVTNIVGLQNMTAPTSVNSGDGKIIELASAIANLPLVFEKYEMMTMDVPEVEINQVGDVLYLSLALPGKPLPPFEFGEKSLCYQEFIGDGISRTFGLVYKPITSDTGETD